MKGCNKVKKAAGWQVKGGDGWFNSEGVEAFGDV